MQSKEFAHEIGRVPDNGGPGSVIGPTRSSEALWAARVQRRKGASTNFTSNVIVEQVYHI